MSSVCNIALGSGKRGKILCSGRRRLQGRKQIRSASKRRYRRGLASHGPTGSFAERTISGLGGRTHSTSLKDYRYYTHNTTSSTVAVGELRMFPYCPYLPYLSTAGFPTTYIVLRTTYYTEYGLPLVQSID